MRIIRLASCTVTTILLLGCSSLNKVYVVEPISYQHELKVPFSASFSMPDKLRERMTYQRIGPTTGFTDEANKTSIPIGEYVYTYGVAYLSEGFADFKKDALDNDGSSICINVVDIDISKHISTGYAASKLRGLERGYYKLSVTISITNSARSEVFRKTYSQESALATVFTHRIGGSSVLIESIQKSFHYTLEKLFLELVNDISTNYQGWNI